MYFLLAFPKEIGMSKTSASYFMAATVDEADQPDDLINERRTRNTLTERGRSYQLGQLQEQREAVQRKLRKQMSATKSLIDSMHQTNW